MTTTLYQLPPSPNNIKVRLALGYFGIDYETVDLPVSFPPDPADRRPVIELTGQPFTPALHHRGVAIYDSRAILRFLDANDGTPERRLFSADPDEMREIEEWETYARTELAAALGIAVGQAFAGTVDAITLARAGRQMNELTGRIEEALMSGSWLVGDTETMSAADVTAAPIVAYAMVNAQQAESGPILAFLYEHFELGEGRDRTRAWVERVMQFDGASARV